MKKYNIAVVGATGMVGRTFLKVLEEVNLPAESYTLYASARSAGSKLPFMGTEYEVKELATLEQYVRNIVKKLDIEKAIFNIILVDEEEVHTLNKNYRGVDRKTDVITFALEDGASFKNPEIRMLGDIYLCVPVAYEQAEIYGHSKTREICFLATHGILHLLGYDHMNEEDEKVMFSFQEELLSQYEINR